MRRLLPLLCAAGVLLVGCSSSSDDDGGDAEAAGTTVTTTTAGPTTTTEPRPPDTTFAADDVEALCAALGGLADIDPDADPTQPQVDRLRAIADTAPPGVADPLRDVAAFGQFAVDSTADPTTPTDGAEDLRQAAIEGATLLIAYGNEACDIDVPLFDTLAGV